MNDKTVSRSGKMTSEFWGTLIFVIVIVGNGTPYLTIPETQITMLAALMFGYGASRTLLKNNAIKAEAVADVASSSTTTTTTTEQEKF